MKIAIIGTGGVGGYFGAKMSQAGYDVSFLARGKHLEAIKSNGLAIKSIKGGFHLEGVKATDKIEELGESDLILLGVKAWQVKEVAKELKAIVHKGTIVLPMQNGILAAEELIAELPAHNVIGGLCKILSKIEREGVINHFGIDPFIAFGELNKQITPRMENLKEVFDSSGINAKLSEDIEAELWKKFIAICVSGLLAVSKTTYGELRDLPETRQMAVDLFTEIFNLSQAAGVNIAGDYVEKTVQFMDTFPHNSTSSLTRDVWEGKPSEIEYQNGTVVKLAEKYGIEVPVNKFVYHSILPMELKARGEL